ncbi:MAG TPA: acyltransferase [Planctomycetaceae bacterium]|nr:acyltransferase [Planctomycetaceae bacterium]
MAVGVTDTRTDADEAQEAGVLPGEWDAAPPVAAPSSALPAAPVLIQPERAAGPPLVKVRRFAFLDGLRALSAHAIVWHHIAFYGPLSDIAYPLMPTLIELLAEYGRMAVQIFLVMGGFVAAQGLSRTVPATLREMTQQAVKRYWRLAWPYLFVIGVAILANAAASRFMTHESIAAPPTLPQVVAHVFFLQTLLGYESLSSGFWYLAIDLQLSLFTLIACTLIGFIARRWGREDRTQTWAMALFLPLAVASLFWWNRDADHDIWAGYYFGSYFIGLTTGWSLTGRISYRWFAVMFAVVMLSLASDFRTRPALALATGMIIAIAGVTGGLERWLRSPFMAYWGKLSYSLFLIHFPVCLVMNAVLGQLFADHPVLAAVGMVLAWLTSCAAAVVFHHLVEETHSWRPVRKVVSGRFSVVSG